MIKVVEAWKNAKHIDEIIRLGRAQRDECAPHLPFVEDAILRSFTLLDDKRERFNCWIAYKNDKAIGFALGQCSQCFFNNDVVANIVLVFIEKEHRGTYAYIKLMKQYEEWARINGALQIYAGVQRLEADEAKHIRKLFPKLGYKWCGSNFVKETVR